MDAVTAERCGASRLLKYSPIAAGPAAMRCAEVPQSTASGSYKPTRRVVSLLLKASTQAVVAAAIRSCAVMPAGIGGAGCELNTAGASPVACAIGFTLPSARKRVVAILDAAPAASTAWIPAQSNFGSTRKYAAPRAGKSCSMRASSGFDTGPPRQRMVSAWRPDETRKRVCSPFRRSNTG